MTIGVAEFGDAYSPQDLANYAACVGIATPNVQNINVDGHLASGSGQGEAMMDLELNCGACSPRRRFSITRPMAQALLLRSRWSMFSIVLPLIIRCRC